MAVSSSLVEPLAFESDLYTVAIVLVVWAGGFEGVVCDVKQ